MTESIGGYFSLELPKCEEYHNNALHLNTGRNCLEYILRCRKYNKVYIPYYTCEVILEPFYKLGIDYSYYHINEKFELSEEIYLQKGEALLYTNYFALKQNYIETLVSIYGNKLIVDNTQAFYAKPFSGIDTFYTCRKFFGVPDGAYLYTDAIADFDIEQDVSYQRMTFLLKRIDMSPEAGFEDFHKSDCSLDNQPIKKMSKLTQRIMQSIDYVAVAEQRKNNFSFLHTYLHKQNEIIFENIENGFVPMVYPFLINGEGLRNYLIKNKIYVAQYWPNILELTDYKSIEYKLTKGLVSLPIDQRYINNEMQYIIKLIKKYA